MWEKDESMKNQHIDLKETIKYSLYKYIKQKWLNWKANRKVRAEVKLGEL